MLLEFIVVELNKMVKEIGDFFCIGKIVEVDVVKMKIVELK